LRSLIDTLFQPLLNWLNLIYTNLHELSVPLSRPLDLSKYLGVFGYLGPAWISFILNILVMAFIYVVCLVIIAQHGLILKFKETVKWW
jgi:hypothetical protein